MTTLTTLGKVWDRVDALSRLCRDDTVPVGDITFDSLDSVRIAQEPHPLRPTAQQHICNRLGVPAQYLRRCPVELQQENLNYWIEKEKNDELFFRFDGDEVRAIFTPRYIPVDNFEVMERLDSLGYGPGTEVQCSLDAEFLSVSIPDSRKTFAINGDRITPGISISNSEVGLSSLRIAAFFLRLVCTNGLITRQAIGAAYRHVSTKIFTEFPSIMGSISNGLAQHADRFRISTESSVDNPEATLKSFSRQFGLSEFEQKALTWAWPQEAGSTMFSVIQTFTRAAQMPGLNAESTYRLQRVGGDILAMVKAPTGKAYAKSH